MICQVYSGVRFHASSENLELLEIVLNWSEPKISQ